MASIEEQFIQQKGRDESRAKAEDAAKQLEALSDQAAKETAERVSRSNERSGQLDPEARDLIRRFAETGDLAAIYNLVEHLLKYDRKLPTLLNAQAFEDEVKKMFRRQFKQTAGAARRANETQAERAASGETSMGGAPSLGRLGLIFIDLDDFKKLNADRGYLAADEALKTVARVLNEGLRKDDIKGRFGGEELMAAIEIEGEGDHFVVAEKLRRLIDAAEISYGGQTFHVTASIGAAELKPGETYEQLLDRASWAMKYVKAHGKNSAVPEEVDEIRNWIDAQKTKPKE